MAKENAAAKIERIKEEKSGLDVLKDIYRCSIYNEPVDPEDIARYKWYGLYTQNRNLQDEDDETLYFMMRIKLFQGEINIEKMKIIDFLYCRLKAFTTFV